jgi:hypothetical protein
MLWKAKIKLRNVDLQEVTVDATGFLKAKLLVRVLYRSEALLIRPLYQRCKLGEEPPFGGSV